VLVLWSGLAEVGAPGPVCKNTPLAGTKSLVPSRCRPALLASGGEQALAPGKLRPLAKIRLEPQVTKERRLAADVFWKKRD
jgi:hypothetical protein